MTMRKRVTRLNNDVIEVNTNIDEPLPENFLPESSLAALYEEFTEEDRQLAETDIENYAKFLKEESLK